MSFSDVNSIRGFYERENEKEKKMKRARDQICRLCERNLISVLVKIENKKKKKFEERNLTEERFSKLLIRLVRDFFTD